MNQQIDLNKLHVYLKRETEHMKEEIEQLCIFIKEGVKEEFFIKFVMAVARREGERPSFNVYKQFTSGKELTTPYHHTEPALGRLPPLHCLGEFGSYRYLLGVVEKVINHFMADVPFTEITYYDPSEWLPADSHGISTHSRWPALYKRPHTERFFVKSNVELYRPDEYMENWVLFDLRDEEITFPVLPSANKVERLFGYCGNPLMINRNSKEYFNNNFLNFYLEKTFVEFSHVLADGYTFSEQALNDGMDLFLNEFLIEGYAMLPDRFEIRKTTTRIFKETEKYEELYVALMIYKTLRMLLQLGNYDSRGAEPAPYYEIFNLLSSDFGNKKALITLQDHRAIVIGKLSEKDKVVDKSPRLTNDFKYFKTNAISIVNEIILK